MNASDGDINARETGTKRPNIEENNEEYEPYDHVPQDRQPITFIDAILHFLKACLGTGTLAIPYVFKDSGYVIGVVGTLCMGFISTCCMRNLVSAEYELCKRKKVPHMTYAEVVQAAFEEGPKRLRRFALLARMISNIFVTAFQFGASSIYIVFIASNLKNIYDEYVGNGDTAETGIDVRLIMLYILIPLILILWIPNLKLLVPFTTVANIISVTSFAILFYYILSDLPPIDHMKPTAAISKVPLFFSTIVFSMEAIGMVLPLKNEMAEPKKFGSCFGVLSLSMIPLTIFLASIGFLGYWRYGERTQANVILNLPNDDLLADGVKLFYSLTIYMNYALYCYVVYEIVWIDYLKRRFKRSNKIILWDYVARTSVVLSTFIVAVVVPQLNLFISLVGALCLSTVGIAFPAIIRMLVQWKYRHDTFDYTITIIEQSFIFLFALMVLITGVSTTVVEFIETM